MIREGVEAIINPLDLYAIEIARQLRETYSGEVVAISMGPAKAALAVWEAIAMGCDSAILITDRAVAGSDTWATSYVLSAAIRQLVIEGGNVDMVICGEHGIGHKRKKYMPLRGLAGISGHAAVNQEGLGPQQYPQSGQDIRRLMAKNIGEEVSS